MQNMKFIVEKKISFDKLNNAFEKEKRAYFDSVKQKYVLLNPFDELLGSISALMYIMINFFTGLVALFLFLFVSHIIDYTFSETAFLLSLGVPCMLSTFFAYFLYYTENKKCEAIKEREFPRLKEMKSKVNDLEDAYNNALKELDISPYLKMNLSDVGNLSVVEQNIIQDYKKIVEDTADGDLFKFLNPTKLKNSFLEVV